MIFVVIYKLSTAFPTPSSLTKSFQKLPSKHEYSKGNFDKSHYIMQQYMRGQEKLKRHQDKSIDHIGFNLHTFLMYYNTSVDRTSI